MQKVKEFTYQKLTPEEQKERGILGRLVGTIADFKNPTRNGRLYTEALWDNVFNDPIMKEKIATKSCFGEIGHPTEARDTDMEKIAICLAEEPKKCSDGTLKGVFDILDTPNGRILKTLCDYGCKVGVSSRGNGDVTEDYNGNEVVDPNTYQCDCWDAVILPSVKAARPEFMTESLDQDKKLKTALNESLNEATPEAKKIMEETLKQLNIDYIDKELNEDVNTHKKSVRNKKVNSSTTASNAGVDEAIKSLQESVKLTQTLQAQVKMLQEKLSVCNAKETRLTESLQQMKNENQELKESLESANSKTDELKTQLDEKSKLVESQNKQIEILNRRCDVQARKQKSLTESISHNDEGVQRLNEQLDASKQEIASLKESLEAAKQDTVIKDREMAKKLTHAQSIMEHYQKVAQTAVDKYIDSKAKMLGINTSEIKNRLTEGYSFKDIDKICEDLSNYQLSVNSLPFNAKKPVKIKMTESKESIIPKSGLDDDIDDQLMSLAGKFLK